MKVGKWLHFLVLLVTLQITNSDSFLNETQSNESGFNGTHRIIKRYTQRFPFPKPRLPTLSRPNFPLFPVFGPPPGHGIPMGGDGAFPKIRLRPPTDENLFTEEEEDEEEETSKRKKKRKKKAKGNKRPKPQLHSDSASESVEEKNQEKGESGELTKPKSKGKRKPLKTFGTTTRPKAQEDRTLLTAKKALLVKKAIIAKAAIVAKLAKTKTAGALMYGVTKYGKVKGISVKAPGVVFSVGSTNVEAFNTKVTPEDGEEDEDDDDIEDVLEEDGEDEPSETETDPETGTETETTNTGTDTGTDAIIVTPALSANSDSSNETMNLNTTMMSFTNSMMQQLQEQLQQKQQIEQQMTPSQPTQQFNQNQVPMQMQPERPELYQPQTQMTPAQVQQYQQQPGIQIEYTPGSGENLAILGPPSPTDIEYLKGSKGSKKAKKKAKKAKKAKPRPVNLGVKANLYKKFDELAKQAQNKLSTFIQIDVDFLRKSVTDDAAEPDKFASRTLEVSAESGSSEQFEGNHAPSRFQTPGNVPPPWITPIWKRKYPRREGNGRGNCGERRRCKLKPVWIVYGKGAPSGAL